MTDFTVIFFRKEGFYPITLDDPKSCGKTLREQATEHAERNPGTKRVETMDGEILWRPQ